jgi:hypothetical protein
LVGGWTTVAVIVAGVVESSQASRVSVRPPVYMATCRLASQPIDGSPVREPTAYGT